MKLDVLLNSLVGQTITAQHIATISTEIDGIKARAIEKAEARATAAEDKLTTANEKITKFEQVGKDADIKAAFIEAGGDESKFKSFQKVSGDIKDVKKFNFVDVFKEFNGLAREGSEFDDEGNFTAGDVSLGGGSGEGTNKGNGGDGGSGEGDGEGTLIA